VTGGWLRMRERRGGGGRGRSGRGGANNSPIYAGLSSDVYHCMLTTFGEPNTNKIPTPCQYMRPVQP